MTVRGARLDVLGPRGSARPARTQQEGTSSHTATLPSLPKPGRWFPGDQQRSCPTQSSPLQAGHGLSRAAASCLHAPALSRLQPHGPANPISAQEPELPEVPTRSEIHSCRDTAPLHTSSAAAPRADSEACPDLCRHPPADVQLAPPRPPALANEVHGLRLIRPALYFGHISIC